MSAPAQIQIRYIPEEDRILMRMNTLEDEEYRFWLTRRFCLRLWPVLQEALFSTPTATQQTSQTARQAVVAFEHEAAKSKAEFNASFRESKNLPLGINPLLVATAGFHQQSPGVFFLTLQNVNKEGINITLTTELLHLVCKLLEDAGDESDWRLPPLVQSLGLDIVSPDSRHLN